MTDGLTRVALGACIAAGASLAGVALVAWQPKRTRASALAIAAFAAGIILGAAFLHLLPEAYEHAGSSATAWLLGAFFLLYVLETHVVKHEHHEAHAHDDARVAAALHALVPAEAHAAHLHAHPHEENDRKDGITGASFASIAAFAFALHSAFDGLAIGVGFSASLGAASTLGVLAHKVPEGIALAALLLRGGFSTTRVVTSAAGIALLTPLIAVVARVMLGDGAIDDVLLGRLLALVAGSFAYIASADLLPEVAHHPKLGRTLLVLGGALGVGLLPD